MRQPPHGAGRWAWILFPPAALALVACGGGATTSAPLAPTVPECCPVADQSPLREDRLVRGPYPSREDIAGEWAGGLRGTDGWRTLAVAFDCACENGPEWRQDGDGVAARAPFAISGRTVRFRLPVDPTSGSILFEGELSRGDLVGATEDGSAFFLERRYFPGTELLAAYDGLYNNAFQEFVSLYHHDGGLAMQDGRDAMRLVAVGHEVFHTPRGERLAILRDQTGEITQIDVIDWDGNLVLDGNRRDWRREREVTIGGREGMDTAVFHDTSDDRPSAVAVVVPGRELPHALHPRVTADQFFAKGFRILELAPGAEFPEVAGAMEFLANEGERVRGNSLVLYADGPTGVELAGEARLAGAFAAMVLVTPGEGWELLRPETATLVLLDDDGSEELRRRVADWNEGLLARGQRHSEARLFADLASPSLRAEGHLWRYPEDFFEAIMVFSRTRLPMPPENPGRESNSRGRD